MKHTFYFTTVLTLMLGIQHSLCAEPLPVDNGHQQCLKLAQDKYDNCIDHATAIMQGNSQNTSQFNDAKQKLYGGCEKILQKELLACEHLKYQEQVEEISCQ